MGVQGTVFIIQTASSSHVAQEDDAYTGIDICNLENGNMGPLSSFPDYAR